MVVTSNPGLLRRSKVHAGLAAVRQSNEMAWANILFDIGLEHAAAGWISIAGGPQHLADVIGSPERSDTSRCKIIGDVGRYAFRLYFLLAIAHWPYRRGRRASITT